MQRSKEDTDEFCTAKDSVMISQSGKEFIDFDQRVGIICGSAAVYSADSA